MNASEIVAKLERQFERGIISAVEFSSELMAVAIQKGEEAVKEYERKCPYVVTIITGLRSETRYIMDASTRDMVYDDWNLSMTNAIDVVQPGGGWLSTGMNHVENAPSSFLSTMRCVRVYDVDCPCNECL